MMKKFYLSLFALVLFSCSSGEKKADAYGNFEADELSVSSEIPGRLIYFSVQEGMSLNEGDTVAVVDTMQLHLKRLQLEATIRAVRQKLPDAASQLSVYDERLRKLETEEIRAKNLVDGKAAPSKTLDDVRAEIDVVRKQKAAMESTLGTQTRGMLSEIEPLQAQLMQVEDQIQKSIVRNPVKGTVLVAVSKASEVVGAGRPMYKIASLDPLTLRAFIPGSRLSSVKIGDKVKVSVDGSDGKLKDHEGEITWVSSEAEFTPRIIQTREERVNQVYALKVRVPNDGSLKIGMPAEVNFTSK